MISSCSLVSRFCLANDSLESPDFKFSIASGTSLNFAESLVGRFILLYAFWVAFWLCHYLMSHTI